MPALDPSSIQIKDYLHVKGVRLVEPDTPQWRIKPLQEKNLKLIAEYLVQEAERQKEEEKWAAVPEWKQQLLKEKEKKNRELEEAQRKLEEAERAEKEKFESLPEWKQKLLIKKKSSSDMDVNSDTKSVSSNVSEPKSAEGSEILVISEERTNNGHTEAAADENSADGCSESSITSASKLDHGDITEDSASKLDDGDISEERE